jgi:integrase
MPAVRCTGGVRIVAFFRTIHLTQTEMDILTQLKEEQPYRKEAPELDQILPYKDKRANNIRYLHMKDLVFINFRTGMPTKNSAYDTHLRKLCEKAGIRPFCMHTLRHTFATRCIEYGIRPKVLQQILGHASLKTTMDRYVHNTEDSMTDAVNLFEAGCRENGVNFLKMA